MNGGKMKEPELSKWQSVLCESTGVFDLAEDPPPEVVNLSEEAMRAWADYLENPAYYARFTQVVGGPTAASKIKQYLDDYPDYLDKLKERYYMSGNPFETTDKGKFSSSKWDDLEFEFEGEGSNFTTLMLGLIAVISIGTLMIVDDSFTTLGILLISLSLGFHLFAVIWLEILNMSIFESRPRLDWNWKNWSYRP